jgi:hypothetical protein
MEWVQEILVFVIVTVCAIFSAWRLMSPTLRLRTLEFFGPIMTKLGAGGPLRRIRSKTIGQLASGCGSCSHNKTAVLGRPGQVDRSRPGRG